LKREGVSIGKVFYELGGNRFVYRLKIESDTKFSDSNNFLSHFESGFDGKEYWFALHHAQSDKTGKWIPKTVIARWTNDVDKVRSLPREFKEAFGYQPTIEDVTRQTLFLERIRDALLLDRGKMVYDSIKASKGIAEWEAPPGEGDNQNATTNFDRQRVAKGRETERVFLDEEDRYWLTLDREASFPIVRIDAIPVGISWMGGEAPSSYMPRRFTAIRDEDSILKDDAFAPPERGKDKNTKTIFLKDFEFDSKRTGEM
jgi:hypothetical protein